LEVVVAADRTAGPGLPEKDSYLSVDRDNVVVTALKKAEDDDGTVLRMDETDGKDVEVTLTFRKAIRKAYSTSLTEEGMKEIPVSGHQLKYRLGHHAIETVKIYW
jgi:alpha-mannosidase